MERTEFILQHIKVEQAQIKEEAIRARRAWEQANRLLAKDRQMYSRSIAGLERSNALLERLNSREKKADGAVS